MANPGELLYSSVIPSDREKQELILDLGREFRISRLRLVWTDENSVPREWKLEVSTDGESWHTFVESNADKTDNFSRWPGFEYYAAQPVQVRYVKYRPEESIRRPIRLRQLSVYR